MKKKGFADIKIYVCIFIISMTYLYVFQYKYIMMGFIVSRSLVQS